MLYLQELAIRLARVKYVLLRHTSIGIVAVRLVDGIFASFYNITFKIILRK